MCVCMLLVCVYVRTCILVYVSVAVHYLFVLHDAWSLLLDCTGSGIQSSSVMAFQYTLIASDNITRCSKLLQLLESRYQIISGEYIYRIAPNFRGTKIS